MGASNQLLIGMAFSGWSRYDAGLLSTMMHLRGSLPMRCTSMAVRHLTVTTVTTATRQQAVAISGRQPRTRPRALQV